MTKKELVASTEIPNRSDNTKVQLSEHITFQWTHDGAAYHIEVQSSKRDQTDIYIDTSLKLINEWPRTQDFFSFQDISHDNFEMTPYLRGRLNEVLSTMKNSGMKGHSVIVMSNSFTGRIMQALGRFFANQAKPIHQHWVTDINKGKSQLAGYIQEATQQ
jgi:hypothetical protein